MSLFRKEAIRQYMDPDARGGVLEVAPPSGWKIFAALAALFALAVFVAVTQSVSVTAAGRGVVRPRAGVRLVQAPAAGRVAKLRAKVGERVAAGAPLVELASDGSASPTSSGAVADLVAKQRAEVVVLRQAGQQERANVLAAANADLERAMARARAERAPAASATTIDAPVSGVVDALSIDVGDVLTAGVVVAKVVPDTSEQVGYMAIEGKHRAQLGPGRKVRLKLDEHPSEEAGFGSASVRRISSDAIDPALSDPLLAATAADPSVPMYQLELELEAMPTRADGEFVNGMTFTGEVVLRQQRIIALLFPPLARMFD